MSPVVVIAAGVWADAIRRKVVWMVVVFAAVLAFVAPSLPSYGLGVAEAVFREVAMALMYTAALIVTIAMAATRVPAEVERRTVYGLLARDVRRWHYLVGTWMGVFAVTGAVLAAATGVTLLIGMITYGGLMFRLAAGAFAIWLEMGAVGALALMLSTRVGAVTSTVGALVFAFVGHSVSTLFSGGAEGVTAPWYIPSLELFDVVNAVAHGQGYTLTHGIAMTAAAIGWIGALLLGASMIFEGRDL